jgi:hypothetical protein
MSNQDRPRFEFATSENALIHTLCQHTEDGVFPVLDTVESGQVLHSQEQIEGDTMDNHPPTMQFLKGVVMLSNPYKDYDLPRDMMAYEFEALMMIQSSGFDDHEPKTPEIEKLTEYAMAHVEEFRPLNDHGPVMREDVLPMDSDHLDEGDEDTSVETEETEKENPDPLDGDLKELNEDVLDDPLIDEHEVPAGSLSGDVPSVPSAHIGEFLNAGYGFGNLVNADPAEVAEAVGYIGRGEAAKIVQEANQAARQKLSS